MGQWGRHLEGRLDSLQDLSSTVRASDVINDHEGKGSDTYADTG
jgi:hypothetical protein